MEKREIKFRCLADNVWHYATLDEITKELGWEYGIPNNVSAFIEGKHKTQYTGLKDKNGKEIYEGDICRNGDLEPDAHAYNYRTEVIQYVEDEGSFIGWNPSIDCMTCEVIGNIYENPELLET